LEWEQLTEAVDGDWRALRQGARRLKAKFAQTVLVDAIEQHLAYALFDIAVNWGVNPRIVRTAFSRVWSGRFDPYLRISASAQFWAWAGTSSQVDMGTAERAVTEARELMRDCPDPLKRTNLERMMHRLTGASR
jgi:peptide subunit release factor RF-3